MTHLLDPQPTEIHFFVSRYLAPMSLMVGTMDNDTMWSIDNGHFTGRSEMPEAARRP